jgi:hypothetical protein
MILNLSGCNNSFNVTSRPFYLIVPDILVTAGRLIYTSLT